MSTTTNKKQVAAAAASTFVTITNSNLLHILSYLPHSKIPSLAVVSSFFLLAIHDFPLFHEYTLTFDCGRRGSMVGKTNKGFVDSKGRITTSRNPEVTFHDSKKRILISTSSKPLKSSKTTQTLHKLSATHINKIHFKSYRISNNPPPLPSSSSTSTLTLPSTSKQRLTSIQELTSNTTHTKHSHTGPPPSRSHNAANLTNASLSPSQSNPLPFTHSSPIDTHLESLLLILSKAPINSLTIGEECISWEWPHIMTTLKHFTKLAHLAVHVGFDHTLLPTPQTEALFVAFLAAHKRYVAHLRSLYCLDDAFLRCITSLRHGLEYVRFRSPFAPECGLTGAEVCGVKVLEITAYDGMLITIPKDTFSFRLGGWKMRFYDEPDEYGVVVPVGNEVRELCVANVACLMTRVRGLSGLVKLQRVVIGDGSVWKDVLECVQRLCRSAPLRVVVVRGKGKDRVVDVGRFKVGETRDGIASLEEHPKSVTVVYAGGFGDTGMGAEVVTDSGWSEYD